MSNVAVLVADVTITMSEVMFRSVINGSMKSAAWLAAADGNGFGIGGKNTVVVPSVPLMTAVTEVVAALIEEVLMRTQPRVMVPGPEKGVKVTGWEPPPAVATPMACAVGEVPPAAR